MSAEDSATAAEIVRLRLRLDEVENTIDDRVAQGIADATSQIRSEVTGDERTEHARELLAANRRVAQAERERDDEKAAATYAARSRAQSRYSTIFTPFAPRRMNVVDPALTHPASPVISSAVPARIATAVTRPSVRIPQPAFFSAIRKKDQVSLRSWLFALLNYFDAVQYNINDEASTCILTAAALFAPDVAVWYRTEYLKAAHPAVITWEYFVQCMIDKFEPVPADFIARAALKVLKQTGSIDEYNAEFSLLISQVTDMGERDKIERYHDGLKPALYMKVLGELCTTLLETMTVAVQHEAAWIQGRDRRQAAPHHFQRNNRPMVPLAAAGRIIETAGNQPMQLGYVATTTDDADDDDEKKPPSSYSLAAMQSQRPNIPKLTDAARAELQSAGKCFRCRQKGHIAKNCTFFGHPKNE
jgi:hypothetical protein